MHNHTYETIVLFLTGVGFGMYLHGLRRFYNATHPPDLDRPARQADNTKAQRHAAPRALGE